MIFDPVSALLIFLSGVFVGALAPLLFSHPDDGPKEQALPAWIAVGPGHVVRLRLPLRNQQALDLIKHVSRGGELTARALKGIGLSGLDYEKVREELIARELVTLGAKDKMIPLPALKNFFATEYETAKQSDRNNHGKVYRF